MTFVRIPRILKKVYPGLTWHIPGDGKTLYLTFDDGPTPQVTDRILDILGAYGVRATFFCIGRNVERYSTLMNRILEAGHAVGNHTYSHLRGWYTPDREYFDDIELAGQLIPSRLFRPAYGMITPNQVKHLKQKYQIVLWDVMSFDFHPGTSPEKCLDNVIRYAQPGSVIVFHDSLKASEKVLHALPGVLASFTEQGFSFGSIPPGPS
jgi:peptidoglycan/xylan/chitin deacetylase (PgdA/CDA1 family)